MVAYLKDLIAGLPDKKPLGTFDEFGLPRLPELGLIETLEQVKARMKINLEALPAPEEQPTLEPYPIEKKLLDYQKVIDDLANHAKGGTYIFLDNIFPIPLRRNEYMNYMTLDADEPRYFVRYPSITIHHQALALWHQLLRTNYNQIFIPQECWNQAIAGKTCLEGTERDERRGQSGFERGVINSDLGQYLQEFAGLRNDCGQESTTFVKPAGNIFYVWNADRQAYDTLISQIIEISTQKSLKQKRNGNAHKDDAHADEILVASAAFQAIKTKSPSLIVSNDRDVDRIRRAYLDQFEQDYPHKDKLEIGLMEMPKLDDSRA